MRYSKWLKITCVSLVLIALGYLALHFWQTRGWQKACGTYLVGGGETYITISGTAGWLKVEGYVNVFDVAKVSPQGKIPPNIVHSAWFRDGSLRIKQNVTFPSDEIHWQTKHVKVINNSNIILQPSSNFPGDWDVLEGSTEHTISSFLSQCLDFKRSFSKVEDLFRWDVWKWAFENFCNVHKNGYVVKYAVSNPIQRRFLHRVDDSDIPEYFERRFRNERGDTVLQMVRGMQQRHPLDGYLALHRAEMEAWAGNLKEAEDMWAVWEASGDIQKDVFLKVTAPRVWKSIYMARFHQLHPEFRLDVPGTLGLMPPGKETPYSLLYADAVDSPSSVTSGTLRGSYEDSKEWLLALRKMETMLFLPSSLVPAFAKRDEERCYLSFDGLIEKVNGIVSRCNPDITLLEGTYVLSQILLTDTVTNGFSLGTMIQGKLFPFFELYLSSVCATPKELRDFAKFLGTMEREWKLYQEKSCSGSVEETTYWNTPLSSSSSDKTTFRLYDVTAVRYQMLKIAAIIRAEFLATGEFPESSADVASLLDGGMPPDPFCTTCTLQCKITTDSLLLYSVGPNGIDEGGTFVYYSLSGERQPGDIVLSLPKKSPYPYQKNGVRAINAADLLPPPPNGLPPNFGSGMSGMPLSILDATSTEIRAGSPLQ